MKVTERQKNNQKVEKKLKSDRQDQRNYSKSLQLDNDKENNIDTNYNQNIINEEKENIQLVNQCWAQSSRILSN